MSRGAKGCLLAAGAMLVVLVIVAAAVMLAGGVKQGTVLELVISGPVVEDAEDTLQARLFAGKITLLRDITVAIERAREDDRVVGIRAVIKPYQMGLGKVQEIRDSVIRFRDAGKWAHVYMDTAGEFGSGNSIYYLATAFDEIWLSPAGDLNLYGILGVTPFMRGTLDKLGIYPEFDSIGKYKNAKDIYTEKSMTEAHREATSMYLQDWFGQMIAGIAEARDLDVETVRALIDDGPFTGQEALDRGLVDHLAYADEFESALDDLSDGENHSMSPKAYLDKKGDPPGRNRIAVITGTGIILTGKSSVDPAGEFILGSETMAEAFRKAREDRRVKAVVFRVDSPGGSPVGSDLIRREMTLTLNEKPVIISMSDLAASGGYWIAAGATRIVSQPATLTGSIGVVAGKMVTTGLFDWIGLNREAIGIGAHASYYYDGARYSEEEKEVYWKFMRKIYDRFTALVAESRGMTVEEVDRIGQGRVWTGERARELGLVDELGGLQRAVELAKQEAGLAERDQVRLIFLPEKRTFLQNLLWSDETSAPQAALPPEVLAAVRAVSRAALLAKERVWLLAEPAASLH